jgi:TRAP-type transport system periplasmic protein
MNTALGRRHFTAFAAAAAVTLPLPNAHAATAWRLATGYRSESFQTVNLTMMANEIDAATQGEQRIAIHPNNTLVKLADMRAAVQEGKVEAGETIMSSLAAEMPIAGADSVPFITASYADARRMWRHQRPLIERHFAARGLVVLYAVPWPPQGLYATTPITDIADLAGRRMRSYNPTTARIATLVGATPVDVPMVEVGKALADGRIDSMITSAVTGVENQVWSHLRYYYEINAWFPKNIVFVNAQALKALSPSARDALRKAAVSAEARGWAASEAAALASVGELRRNGIRIERVPREVSVVLKRLGERFSLEWIRQVGAEANDIFIPYFTKP